MATEKPNLFYMKFYPKDFLMDPVVAAMTLRERGAYITLLCHAWVADEPGVLVNNDKELARLSGAGRAWKGMSERVKRAFSCHVREGFLIQKRMVQEHQEAQEQMSQNVANGLRGAKKRWGGHSPPNNPPNSQSIAGPIASPSKTYSDPNSSQIHSHSNSYKQQPSKGDLAGGEVIQKLKVLGVDTARLPADKLNGATCNDVIRHWLDILTCPKMKNPQGALVKRLLGDEGLPRKQPTPKMIADAVRRGVIVAFNDRPICGDAKYNSDGVKIDGVIEIPAALIEHAVFE